MDTEEAYIHYKALRVAGFSKEQAFEELATYLHPIALAQVKKLARADETQELLSMPVRRVDRRH